MDVNKKLLMTFMNTLGRKVSISVDDPRENITEAEIKACMDLIIEKNIFAPNDADLESVVEAKIVITDTSEFDLVL
ncbi:MAG: DUF2922 domain-containing protein [Clostridia bacterium]